MHRIDFYTWQTDNFNNKQINFQKSTVEQTNLTLFFYYSMSILSQTRTTIT